MEKTEVIPRITVPPKAKEDPRPAGPQPVLDDRTVRIDCLPPGERTHVASPSFSSEYTILKKIGDGGMGVVYLAREHKLGRYVAVKRLKEGLLKHPVLLKRFAREAKAIASLNHGHIVHVYALDEDAAGPYIVMEYVEGPRGTSTPHLPSPPYTLSDRVAEEGHLHLHDTLDLMIKLCQAVGYAHRCGVVHRDLKPSNVLIDTHGEPKIVDFGLALRLAPDDDPLTVPGEKMLSLGYGAPEQESGNGDIDERADVYGLGAILFFCMTGQNPRYFRPNQVPEIIRDLLVKALETDRHKRLSSAREFEQRLMLIKAPSSIEIPTTKATWRCKWCNSSNPTSVKYCGECGWDGTESCPECGKETRIGIQYCGHCGADAREYEGALALHSRFNKAWSRKEYETIIQHAGQISGFQPAGPAGQHLIDDIRDLRARSEKAIARLAELRRLIPAELKQQNFLLARDHIEEYRRLAIDHAFDPDFEKLPSLALDHELERARGAIRLRDWKYASHVAREILSSIQPGNPEARAILRHCRFAPWWIAFRNVCFASGLLFLAYLLAAPPLFHLARDPANSRQSSFFSLAILLHDGTGFLRSPLERYARFCRAEGLFNPAPDKSTAIEPLIPSGSADGKDNSRAGIMVEYKKSLYKIEAEHSREEKAWPAEYSKSLRDMQRNAQQGGDFDVWQAIKSEIDRFELSQSITDGDLLEFPRELLALQNRYLDKKSRLTLDRHQKIEALCRRQLQKLEILLKTMTKQDKMDEAADVSREIKRIKSSPEYLAAQAAIEAHRAQKKK